MVYWEASSHFQPAPVFFHYPPPTFSFFSKYWRVNPGPWACQASALPLSYICSSFFTLFWDTVWVHFQPEILPQPPVQACTTMLSCILIYFIQPGVILVLVYMSPPGYGISQDLLPSSSLECSILPHMFIFEHFTMGIHPQLYIVLSYVRLSFSVRLYVLQFVEAGGSRQGFALCWWRVRKSCWAERGWYFLRAHLSEGRGWTNSGKFYNI